MPTNAGCAYSPFSSFPSAASFPNSVYSFAVASIRISSPAFVVTHAFVGRDDRAIPRERLPALVVHLLQPVLEVQAPQTPRHAEHAVARHHRRVCRGEPLFVATGFESIVPSALNANSRVPLFSVVTSNLSPGTIGVGR